MNKNPFFVVFFLFALLVFAAASGQDKSGAAKQKQNDRETKTEFKVREFQPLAKGYKGNGISYGPYREGQRPGGTEPSKAQIREDLKLLVGDKWEMIRTYGTEPFARKVCEVIREDKLDLKVMVGAWVATEKDLPEAKKTNQGQVDRAIKLANEFPKIVVAVSIANESQVFWSFHKVQQATLVRYIRQVRSNIKQPVTVADDFKYWTTDESKAVANELDFIVTHIYAMWLGEKLDNAVAFTQARYKDVVKKHPNKKVVIGEAGWATKKTNGGDQGKLIKGQPGESQQQTFYKNYTDWLQKEKIGYFYFEAFDEPWKGGDDPNDAEKNWGLFRVDRTRKPAVKNDRK